MLTIAQFAAFVQDEVFPGSLESLKKCETVEDVQQWRLKHAKLLASKMVQGESIQDMCKFDVHPQEEEESKDNLSMPHKIFLAAKKCHDEFKAANIH